MHHCVTAHRPTRSGLFTWDPHMEVPLGCIGGGAPIKTAQGHQELRHRVHALSQRHRTLLLLVDGQRSLDQVLDLGRRAGAEARHFDELVQLGLVAPPPGLATTQPATRANTIAVPAPRTAPRLPQSMAIEAPSQPSPAPLAAPEALDIRSLEKARSQLIELLRLDAPLSALRLGKRVRAATDADELSDLVLEIEQKVHPVARSHAGRLALEGARNLLGMGNTLVCEDTEHAPLEA